MNMRFLLLFSFVSGLLCADEWGDFVTTFHAWHQVTCKDDPCWDATRMVANRLYYDAWYKEKNAEKFFKKYCSLMRIKTENNEVRPMDPKKDGESYRARALYAALTENYEATVADARKKMSDCAYQERVDDFKRQLDDAGVIWVTKEQEDRFWQGKRDE